MYDVGRGLCSEVRIFCLDSNPECFEACSFKHPFKVTIIYSLNQLIFCQGERWFTWLVQMWVADPFLPNLGIFCSWEAMLKLFWKPKIFDPVPAGWMKARAHVRNRVHSPFPIIPIWQCICQLENGGCFKSDWVCWAVGICCTDSVTGLCCQGWRKCLG